MVWLDMILKYIPIVGSIRRVLQTQDTIKLGIQSLLRHEMYELNEKYPENVPDHVKERFQDLYNSYHALGGNGVMTVLYDDFIRR